MKDGLSGATLVAFSATCDPDRARAFYGKVLGLALVDQTPFSMVFDANGTRIRLQFVEQVVAPPYTVLGWEVADLDAVLAMLSDHGVSTECYPGLDQDHQGVWTVPDGTRVAWFKDPDGNTISLTQVA